MIQPEMLPKPASTKPKHRWAKGESGNPAGRKKGARHKALVALDLVGQGSAVAIMQVVIEKALDGDLYAASLLLARLWPVRKGAPVSLGLPPINRAADLPGALAVVTAAVASGHLTPDEAASVSAILDAQRRAFETVELEQRIKTLEDHHAGRD